MMWREEDPTDVTIGRLLAEPLSPSTPSEAGLRGSLGL